jgi:hypothetical protein
MAHRRHSFFQKVTADNRQKAMKELKANLRASVSQFGFKLIAPALLAERPAPDAMIRQRTLRP